MKNQTQKTQKPNPANENKIDVGENISNSVVVNGNGNVVNVVKDKPPSKISKKKPQQRKTSKFDIAIIVAFIGLLGTITAALINSPFLEKLINKIPVIQNIDPYMGIYPDSKVSTAPVPTSQMPDSKLLSEINNPETFLTPNPSLADKEIVKANIETEVKASSERNLLLLESIYAPNSVVINRMKTPYDSGDDLIYTGWDNIRQLHYVNLFKSQVWQSPIYLTDLQIEISNNKATGTHRGIVSKGNYFPDYSIYTLEKIDGVWLITQLEYGNIELLNK